MDIIVETLLPITHTLHLPHTQGSDIPSLISVYIAPNKNPFQNRFYQYAKIPNLGILTHKQ